MPYIPILAGWPEWVYVAVGLGASGLLWWKNHWWVKAAISVVLFIGAAYAFQFAGMHMCFEGSPPAVLEVLFGGLAASLPWLLGRWKWPVPVAFIAVFFTGTFLAGFLASSYHGEDVSGNPDFSSGQFWHTPISGQYPRDLEKTQAFHESLR